jgi:nucleotide-binding universal stress UspA family protein
MLSIRTILYPTDFSDPAAAAFPLAVALARDYGAKLIVLYVEPSPISHGELVARRQDHTDGLWRMLQELQARPTVHVEHRLKEGAAAEVILRTAAEDHVDLIIMGTHGRTGLERLLMGSVAEQVLRRAPCLVLTVRHSPKEGASSADVQ